MAFDDGEPTLRARLQRLVAGGGAPAEPAAILREARWVLDQEAPTGDDIAWLYDRASAVAPGRPLEALVWTRIVQAACRSRLAALGRISVRREERDLRRWLGSARTFEGRLLLTLEWHSAALAALQDVLGSLDYVLDSTQRSRAEYHLVRALCALGDVAAAETTGSRLVATLSGDHDALAASTLAVLAWAHHRQGSNRRAADVLARAAVLAERSGSTEKVGRVAIAAAQVAAAAGDHEGAVVQLDRARSAAASDSGRLAEVEELAARLHEAQDMPAAGALLAERSAGLHELAGEERLALRAHLLSGRLLRLAGNRDAAGAVLVSVRRRVVASGDAELAAELDAEGAALIDPPR